MMKKKKGMKIRILTNKKILTALLIITVCSAVFSQEEKKIADLYLKTSESFYDSNDITQAEVFLNKSLLYYKDSSDAYYLKSLIAEKKSENKETIINSLKKALILRNWNLFREEDAFFYLGKIYTSIKEYKKAVSTLYVIEGDKIDDEDYLDSYTDSLLNSGMFVTASQILNTAVDKFPDNVKFKKKLINSDSDYYDSLLIKILDKNEVYDFEPEVILEVLKNTDDDGVKRELLEKISSFSTEYPEIITEKIKIEKNAEKEDIEKFFRNKGYENLKMLREFRNVLNTDEVIELFNDKINHLSTVIYDDVNNDSINEIVFRIENGVMVWYREDLNQDGLNDFYIYYSDGDIETIEYNEKYLVKYVNYPLLENIIITGSNIDIYDFSNRNTIFDITETEEFLNIPEIYRDFKNRVEKILPRASMHQNNNSEKNLRILEYMKNRRVKLYTEIRDDRTVAEGIIKDGNYKYINRDYNDGSSFETKEIYKNGKLESVLYDGDGDGIFEIKIEQNCRYWDYNKDGIYESYEKNEGDAVFRGFSTEYNGIYDVEEKSINGRIVSVRKNDKWFNVNFDKKNKLFWIGDRPDNIKITESLKENTYMNIDNRMIYVFKIADNYYAEVIN